jgi:glycosyltransferase involved in cell wall biosynthesis
MKRLLILTGFFPPCTLAPSWRVAGWARHLARFGWEPTVVCRYWGVGDDPYALPPDRLVRHEKAEGYSVYWVPYLANARDRWIRSHGLNRGAAVRRALSLALAVLERVSPAFDALRASRSFVLQYLQRERTDALLVTGNPFTLFRVGYDAHRRHRVPWVADYRDCWSTTQLHAQGMLVPSLRAWDRKLERRWVGTAAFFTAASPVFVSGIERVVHRPGHALLTGFSEEEFAREEDALFPDFTLCYLGTLHYPQRVESLLRAVIRLLKELGPEARLRMRMLGVRYFPAQADRVQRAVAGFERHFDLTDRLPRAEALGILSRSHLLVQMGYEGCEGVMGGKIYEYMAARRPTLLFPSDGGILADMVEITGSGFVAESEDSALAHLRALYREWVSTGTVAFRPDPARLAPYSQGAQVERLVGLLDEHLVRQR